MKNWRTNGCTGDMLAIGDAFWNGPKGSVIEGGDQMWRGDGDRVFSSFGPDVQQRLSDAALRSMRRHHGHGNVVFCDGHVEALTLKTLFLDSSDEALARWNYDHEPHR